MLGEIKLPEIGGHSNTWIAGTLAVIGTGAALVDSYVLDPIRDQHQQDMSRQLEQNRQINSELKSISTSLNEIKVSTARVEERVKGLKEQIDELDEDK